MILESEVVYDSKLSKEFNRIINLITDYLHKSLEKKKFKVYRQNEESKVEIPSVGFFYGVVKQNNKYIVANWLLSLPVREKKILLEFVFVKEAFRFILKIFFKFQSTYPNFIEIALNNLTYSWFFETKKLQSIYERNAGFITQRLHSPEEDDFKNRLFTKIQQIVYYNKDEINVIKLVDKFNSFLTDGEKNNLSENKLLEKLELWFNEYEKKVDPGALPIIMKSKHIEILKNLQKLGIKQSTAKKIGQELNLQHDAINYHFLEMMDLHVIYWLPRINYSLIRLFPYTFRVTLPSNKSGEKLIQKLKGIPYIKSLLKGYYNKHEVYFSTFECPHILHQNLDIYFENMKKKGYIKDYFFKKPRKLSLYSTVTPNKYKEDEKLYTKILEERIDLDLHNFTFQKETIDFSFEPKRKSHLFDENVLGFISTLRGRLLPKGSYVTFIDKFIEFCKDNEIDVSNSTEVMDFINTLNRRCMRLGLLKYVITLWLKSSHTNNLYYEIPFTSNIKEIDFLENKLKAFGTLTTVAYSDRLMLTFQGISKDDKFKKIIDEYIQNQEIPFSSFYASNIPEMRRCVSLHKLYNYEENAWKFDFI
jgi:hypothetical protein